MKLVPATGKGRPLITAYGAGGFRFGLPSGDIRIDGSVLVLADQPSPWAVSDMEVLRQGPLETLLAPILQGSGQIEFLLFGTGATIEAPPLHMRERLRAASIGLEIMSTPSACRTYNHLASEGRHFAVAMLRVG
ncbi:Mth938-like domain-containing protein [Candidatus Phycosocius spiralis]|uniref:Membrane protein n=1 Tax=Candidatus Phycosocius spiralis TaxID=2815099 RepID=A0ABQ4PTG8_9PROT|nr:MTH938/NDUFAF3 family protein [Candidatus Phycosocius spiralis]GIU66271.1 membrane protein [Candidatus Phycosocius spiralis]